VKSAPAPADLVIVNAVLVDPVDGKVGSEVVVRDGRIVAIGGAGSGSKWYGLKTRVIDAGRGAVVAGLADAHGHFLGLGLEVGRADLRGTKSEDELVARAAAFAAGVQDRWVWGRGWDQNLWTPATFPTKAKLDAALGSRPAFLTRVDGHAGLVNSAALALAGVDRNTKDPEGGRIVRDAAGEPTGVLVDDAMGLVTRVIPAPSEAERIRAFLAAQSALLAVGLTCIHDAGLPLESQETLWKLDAEGKLSIRVYGMASANAIPARPRKGKRFELRAVKAYADGALGSRGAALLEPYSDDPNNTGLLVTPVEGLDAIAAACAARGLQMCTHAIGDRGNRVVLDCYEKALAALPAEKRAALRWRVEHCQVVAPPDFERFRSLGLIASMQPTHATSDGPWAPARIGAARMEGAYAWKKMSDLGVPLAFGSDFPVELHDPKLGFFAAVARRPPDDPKAPPFGPSPPLTARETLAAFTTGAAFAAFAERERGRMLPNYRADLTIFDRDPFDAEDPSVFLATKAVWTIVDGEVAYEPR
jgi:predicted amidohydrolase YtcJ